MQANIFLKQHFTGSVVYSTFHYFKRHIMSSYPTNNDIKFDHYHLIKNQLLMPLQRCIFFSTIVGWKFNTVPHVSNGDNIHVDTKSTISLSNFSLHLFIRILPLLKSKGLGTSQRAQWLRLHHSNAEGVSLIPGQGTKIPYASWHGQKDLKKEKKIK